MRRALVLAAALAAAGATPAGSGEISLKTFLFLHDDGQNQVYGYDITDGTPDPVAGSPLALGGGGAYFDGDCGSLAWHGGRQLLFATSSTGISVLSVASTGGMTAVAGSPFGTDTTLRIGVATAEVEAGTCVYAARYDEDNLEGFLLQEGNTLVALPGSPWIVRGTGPAGLTVAGRTLVASCYGSGSIESFTIAPDGTLLPSKQEPIPVTNAYHSYVAPGGGAIYAPTYDAQPDVVHSFLVKKKGKLKRVKGSPFSGTPTDTGAAMAISSQGLVLGVGYSLAGSQDVQGFFPGKKGRLLPLEGAQSSGIATLRNAVFGPDGRTLGVVADATGTVSLYDVDPVTAELDPFAGFSIGTGHAISGMRIVER